MQLPSTCRAFAAAALTLLSAFWPAIGWQSPAQLPVGPAPDGSIVVPTNQVLRPGGTRISLPGERVNDVAASAKGDLVAVLARSAVYLYRSNGERAGKIPLQQNGSLLGIAFSPDGRWVAASQTGCIAIIDVTAASMKRCLAVPQNSLPAGVAFDHASATVYVALNRSNGVARIDFASGQITGTADVGVAPLGLALTPDDRRLVVANTGGRAVTGSTASSAQSSGTTVHTDGNGIANSGSISILDTGSMQVIKELDTGLHPGGIAISPDGTHAAIANANSDSISVLDIPAGQFVATIPAPAIPADARGTSPTGLTYSGDGTRLYCSLGGSNSIAVFRVESDTHFTLTGLVGTDWYPVAVAMSKNAYGEDRLWVANSKGIGSREGTGALSVRNSSGTVSVIDARDVNVWSAVRTIISLTPFGDTTTDAPSPDLASLGVRHVFLLVKENRTFDQVLGDVERGNGDRSLAIYGARVTPNQHRLASDFVLFDNFYASGTVSADGHQWLTQATATAYAERQAGAGWPRSYPYSGEDPLVFASTGFIWNNAIRHGLTARIFGEFAQPVPSSKFTWTAYLQASIAGTGTLPTPSTPSIASAAALYDTNYPAFDLGVPDSYRARLVLDAITGWERSGTAPNLVIIQLPGDHTVGTTPGAPTPEAMVADNDAAVARIIEAISKSSLWPTSAVLVTEDDAQDGVDHVDGHRTTCFIASPFARRGIVDSTHYNHTSLVRTAEELLGLPPMNRFDATALPMRAAFTAAPDFTPWSAQPAQIHLDSRNPQIQVLQGPARKAAKASAAMNFHVPDAAPEGKLNRILWQQAKGWGARYPKPPHRRSCPKDLD